MLFMLGNFIAYLCLSFYFDARRRKSRSAINRGKDISKHFTLLHKFLIFSTIPIILALAVLNFREFSIYVLPIYFAVDTMIIGVYAVATGKFVMPSRTGALYVSTNEVSRSSKNDLKTSVAGWICIMVSFVMLSIYLVMIINHG